MGERENQLNLYDAVKLYARKFGEGPDAWRLQNGLGCKAFHLRVLRALEEGVPIDAEKEYGILPYSKLPRDIVF